MDKSISNLFSVQKLNQVMSHKGFEAGLYILGWYFFSLSISLYNKWMFGNGLKFKFPIFITSFHQFCLMLISCISLFVKPKWRPAINGTKSSSAVSFKDFLHSLKMGHSMYIKMILPCALASAGDIGLSNVSFKFISLSLYTMLKTSSLVFVLIFGLIFKLEKFNWRLILIVIIMTFSVLMMVKSPQSVKAESNEDNNFGVILVLGAAIMSGLRWSFTQLLLKRNEYTNNSISTIFYLSPAMCVILFIIGLIFEGWGNFTSSPIWEIEGIVKTIYLMIVPGFMAFMMTLCEFKLLSVAQIITLSIAGIFKELLTIILSVVIFDDKLSLINTLGLLITFADIIWYNYYRYNENKNETLNRERNNNIVSSRSP